jgi:hypothetical protein
MKEKMKRISEDIKLMTAAALIFAYNHWDEFADESDIGTETHGSTPEDCQKAREYYKTIVEMVATVRADQALHSIPL